MNTKILLIALLFLTASLSAEVKDKWKISAGAIFVTNFETEVLLTPKGLPVAAKINTKDQLDMESDTTAFRLDSYYRFNNSHSINFSYFTINSDGNKVIAQDLEWEGNVISGGASVQSYFDMDIYKVNYAYSFYHNEKVELAVTAGLHITSLDLGIAANGTITDSNGNINTGSAYTSSAGVTLPLPVFGVILKYTIIDKRLFLDYKSEYFALKYNDVQGHLISSAVNLEYRFVDHVGVGLGYNTNRIYVKADDGDNKLEVANDLSGVMLYMTYVY